MVSRYYWDSCVFLAYIDGPEERLPAIDGLLGQAEDREIVILTSTLTITEVAFAESERSSQTLDPEIEAKIDALLDSPIVSLVEFDPVIARRARGLMRATLESEGKSLKPKDALHIATAIHENVDAMHTYDEKLFNYSDITGGLDVKPPNAIVQGKLGTTVVGETEGI